MSDPLDFEVEDLLLKSPSPATKRKKVIGLDDLLSDYYIQQSKIAASASKKSKDLERDNSDDEEDISAKGIERKFTEMANECEKQMNQIIAEHEIPLWGQDIFGQQKSPPLFDITGLENCKLFQLLKENELSSDLLLDSGQGAGETFLEGLLINGWLSQLAFVSGTVEAAILSWTFHKVMYSSNEELQLSACDFWCRIILSKKEAGQPSVILEWMPSYCEFKDALEVFGYLSDTSESGVLNFREPDFKGPPLNIKSWIKILSACFQIRNFQSIFSASEAEEFLVVIIRFFLDRQLQGLSFILTECMQSSLSFFTEDEWDGSREKVAQAIAYSVPKDLNSLRVVECISGTSTRIKHLKGQIAIHLLGIFFEKNVSDGKEILKSLVSIKVKDKACNFFNLYIYLVLSDNWLLTIDLVEESYVILNMWTKLLRNCSSNISTTDWRPYASKVRSKASYLLQSTMYQ